VRGRNGGIHDDFLVFGSSFDHCLTNLERVVKRCIEMNLALNWKKCHFMVQERTMLEYKISPKKIEVDKANVEAIENLPLIKIKTVRIFLGHVDFYRRFIKNFFKIAKLLTDLLQKDTPFSFMKECLEAFMVLKDKLIHTPIMIGQYWNLPFEIMCDASNSAV